MLHKAGALAWMLVLAVQDGRLPIPADAEIKKAEKVVRDIFADEYRAKDRASRRMLAQKLLAQAPGTANPAERFVLFRDARDLAADALDFDTSSAASAKLAELYAGASPLTGATFTFPLSRLEALNRVRGTALMPDEASSVAGHFLKLSEEASKAGEFDVAVKAVQAAEQLAKAAGDGSLVKKAAETAKETPLLKAEWEAASKAESAAAKGDPEAGAILGKFLLFAKGDVERGLPLLAKCGDPALRNAALKDGSNSGPEAGLESAEAWWVLAEKEKSGFEKRRYQRRAQGILEQALAAADGLTKKKIEKRMEQMDRAISGITPVDLLAFMDPVKDKVEGVWQLTAQGLLSPTHADGVPHRIQVPFIPCDGDYDITATIEKKSGYWIGIGIVGGGSQTFLQNFGDLPVGKGVNITVEVRKDGYRVLREGKVMVEWKGDWKTLPALGGTWKVPNGKSLLLMSGGSYLFSKLQYRPVGGPGRKLR